MAIRAKGIKYGSKTNIRQDQVCSIANSCHWPKRGQNFSWQRNYLVKVDKESGFRLEDVELKDSAKGHWANQFIINRRWEQGSSEDVKTIVG